MPSTREAPSQAHCWHPGSGALPMAALEFAITSVRACIVTPDLCECPLQLSLLARQEHYNLCRSAVVAKQLRHDPHGPIDAVEERLVSAAQLIWPPFAIGRFAEAVLRTISMTGKDHRTLATIARQPVAQEAVYSAGERQWLLRARYNIAAIYPTEGKLLLGHLRSASSPSPRDRQPE